MATPFDIVQATTDPVPLQPAPDITPKETKKITKVIPNQSWAMLQTLRFIQLQAQNLRDPSQLATVVATSLAPAINASASNPNALTALYAESEERRADVGLDPINETTYKQQRDPKLVTDLIVSLLNNDGMETDLGTDLTVESATLPEVEVIDPNVRPAWKTGTSTSPEESTAITIAEKLGLTVEHTSDELTHLPATTLLSVDSTDPYIKKVAGQ